tara:strand:+ start:181 stop:780 length:600 start_codon:yes stop_codon:yes gene_type:complete
MKTELSKADKVRKILNINVALATETLGEGQVTIEAETFAEGEAVMIVSAEGEEVNEPLPVNEEGYLLDNGMVLVVMEEGIIASIGEKVEEEPAAEGEEPVAASDTKSETPLPKAVIESIVKETKFSKEEMDAKDSEITELKAKIEELSKVETVEEVELSVAPIVHNPESKKEPKKFDFSKGKKQSIDSVLMAKMANLKK